MYEGVNERETKKKRERERVGMSLRAIAVSLPWNKSMSFIKPSTVINNAAATIYFSLMTLVI